MFELKSRVVSAAVFALALAGCGGGGGGSSNSAGTSAQSTASTPQTPVQANTDWSFSGSAPAVTGESGTVAVVFAPDTLTSTGLSGTAFTSSSVPLASMVQQSNYGGAFTTVASTSATASLTKGSTIAEVNGAGGYIAIGRWTHGSDSSGGNYNANQGATYAVGAPLVMTAGTGSLSCSALMSTAPTSATGSVAPGSLQTATATLDLTTLTLRNFSATVTIGADTAATFSKASALSGGGSFGGGVSVITRLMGTDTTKPLVAVAYGAKLANTGDINGLVVLSCQ